MRVALGQTGDLFRVYAAFAQQLRKATAAQRLRQGYSSQRKGIILTSVVLYYFRAAGFHWNSNQRITLSSPRDSETLKFGQNDGSLDRTVLR